jgi:hypothetical protein
MVLGLLVGAIRWLESHVQSELQKTRITLRQAVKEQIPLGSDPERVLNFLTNKRIEHTGYESAGDDETALAVLGAPAIIEGRVKIHTHSFYDYSVHMVFKFDTKGKFVTYADNVESTFY